MPPGGSATIYGVEFCPFPRPFGSIFSTNSSSASNTLVQTDVVTGLSTLIPGTPPLTVSGNWIDYDVLNNDFWLCTAFLTPTQVYLVQQNGNNVLAGPCGAGVAAAIDVNDEAAGTLKAAPLVVPSPVAPMTLDLGLWGRPGNLGVIAIVQPIVVILGVGVIDAAGSFSVSLPGIVLAPGRPGNIRFQAADIHVPSTSAALTQPLSWPNN
jgi:hypothetical protein